MAGCTVFIYSIMRSVLHQKNDNITVDISIVKFSNRSHNGCNSLLDV